jgi:hypothetical protein
MVEFALVLPILLMLIFGIIEFARLFYAWIIVENAARFGVRYASTGNFDLANCIDLDGDGTPCDGEMEDEEIDAARIPSIKSEARNVVIGLHYNESLAQTESDYLKITVCSSRPNTDGTDRLFTRPLMAQPVYSDCQLTEDAGGPGDTVVVSADYNFTFIILPAFGVQPGMIHLASYRQGIVEQFRVSRVVNTPRPLSVATLAGQLPLPTETTAPTNTLAPTNTPTTEPTATPTFTPSYTPTPTMTYTPTVTPTPSCTNIIINGVRFTLDDFEVRVRNNNVAPAYLINSSLEWNTNYVPPMYFNQATFGTTYYTTDHTTSPVNMPAPSILLGGNGASRWWEADFNNATFVGRYGATLTFYFPNWGECTLSASMNYVTPTPSRTPRPTQPRTATSPPQNPPNATATKPQNTPINPPPATATKPPATLPPTQPPPQSTPVPTRTSPPTPRPTFCVDC